MTCPVDERLFWVDLSRTIVVPRRSGIGAKPPGPIAQIAAPSRYLI